MKTISRLILSLMLLVVTQNSQSNTFNSLHIPLDDPMLSRIYEFTDHMLLKHPIYPFHQNQRPYTFQNLRNLLNTLSKKKLTNLEERLVSSYLNYLDNPKSLINYKSNKSEFRLNLELGLHATSRNMSNKSAKREYAWQIRPIVTGRISENLSFSTDLRFYLIAGTNFSNTIRSEVEIDQANDPTFDTAGLTPSYLQFEFPWFNLLIGKQNLSWGPGRYSNLLFSYYSVPMEMIYLKGTYSKIAFHALHAIGQSPHGNKIISAHRISFNPSLFFSIAISEVIVVASDKFDPRFLNPVTIYTITEPSGDGYYENDNPSNLLIGGDFSIKLSNRLLVYGEVMIDDFSPAYGLLSPLNWASKWGVLFGLHLIDFPFDISSQLEFTFVNQYAYTHKHPINAYTHMEKPIGFRMGPDSQSILIGFRKHWNENLLTSISGEIQQKGEQDINTPRDTSKPWEEKWLYLSGTEEIRQNLRIVVDFSGHFTSKIRGTYTISRIVNSEHKFMSRDLEQEIALVFLYRI